MVDISRFTLPRIRANSPITDKDGKAVNAFVLFWEKLCRQIEGQENSQNALIALIQAQSDALAVQVSRLTRQIISTSHVDGLTLTAQADGATAKLTISNHTRVYIDEEVAVTGAVITGLTYGGTYAAYYDDPERDGGTEVYFATLDPTQAVPSAAHPDRHLVGVTTMPASAGDPPTGGGGTRPPGFPPGDLYLEP